MLKATPPQWHLNIRTRNVELDAQDVDHGSDALPGAYTVMTVTDDGTGMTKATRAHIFAPFFTTKHVGKGSGLRLRMALGFVKQSPGHIHVRLLLGEGTSLELFLPCARAAVLAEPAAPRRDPPAPGLSVAREQHQVRMLVVEDDPTLRELVAAQLQRLGYQVVTAGSGHEAIPVLQTITLIDLLFTDIAMPGGMSGIMLSRMAGLQRPNLPVLFTSGFAGGTATEQLEGDADFLLLTKTYRIEGLSLTMRQALDCKHDATALRGDA
jgi:CheY-like chemotaxis protein